MRQHWEEHWRFETANLSVVFETTPCLDDPADSFEFEEDIEAVRSERVAWFDARVRVLARGNELAADYLSGCAYVSIRDFIEPHRDRDPMNRNSSIMRAANGGNVVICHYFPGMVATACAEAREELLRLQSIPVRKAA
jgi:hypothetical protein